METKCERGWWVETWVGNTESFPNSWEPLIDNMGNIQFESTHVLALKPCKVGYYMATNLLLKIKLFLVHTCIQPNCLRLTSMGLHAKAESCWVGHG